MMVWDRMKCEIYWIWYGIVMIVFPFPFDIYDLELNRDPTYWHQARNYFYYF